MFFADNLHFVDVTKKIIEKFFKKYLVNSKKCSTFAPGEMAEWSNAAVLKTVDLHGSGGSNPSLSATKKQKSVRKALQGTLADFFVLENRKNRHNLRLNLQPNGIIVKKLLQNLCKNLKQKPLC